MGLLDYVTGGDNSGILGSIGSGLQNNSQALLGMSSGLLSGQGWGQGLAQGFQGFGQGHAVDQQRQTKKKQQDSMNALLASTNSAAMTPQMKAAIAANPDLGQAYIAQQLKPTDYNVVQGGDGNFYKYNTATGEMSATGPAGIAKSPADTRTEAMKNYAAAKSQGYQGDFVQFQKDWTGKTGDDNKAPQGYRWGAPDAQGNATLEAIPGGPATKLESADAAKVSLANDFLKAAPGVRAKIASGKLTGGSSGFWSDPISQVYNTATGHGEQGEIQRTITGGQEALVRGLTGAGMSETEAKQQAAQYSPSMTDSKDDMLSKFDALTRRLQGMGQVLGEGRGGSPMTGGKATASDPYGIR